MNKLSIITKGIIITMGMVGMAHADSDWSGFHIGVDAGVVFNKAQLKSQQLGFTNMNDHCNISSDFSTFSPGLQLGYTHQFLNAFVLGLEANVAFNTNPSETLSCPCSYYPEVYDSFLFKNTMQRSIKGRLGHALNWNKSIVLPYFTAGVSFADTELSYKNEGGDYYFNQAIHAGRLVGAGLEWAFKKNWSWRIEYTNVNYGNAVRMKLPSVYGLVDPEGHAQINLISNTILVGINYWI